jgi:hypothetical protein
LNAGLVYIIHVVWLNVLFGDDAEENSVKIVVSRIKGFNAPTRPGTDVSREWVLG